MSLEMDFFAAGIGLLLVELFVPSGMFGLAALLAFTAGGYLFLGGGLEAIAMLLAAYILLGILVYGCAKFFPRERSLQNLVLWERQDDLSYEPIPENMVGAQVLALTPLRPAGTVLWGEQRLDAISTGGYIDKGAMVKIVRQEGKKLFVQEL